MTYNWGLLAGKHKLTTAFSPRYKFNNNTTENLYFTHYSRNFWKKKEVNLETLCETLQKRGRYVFFQTIAQRITNTYRLNNRFFVTPLILLDKSTAVCTQKCIIWFIQQLWKTEIAFFLLLHAEGLLLRPRGAWTSFLMCQDFYSFGVQACKTTRGAHLHVNALSTSWCKPISSRGQLDLKLFSNAVSQFIPTWSNLHGALSSWDTRLLVEIECVWGRSFP